MTIACARETFGALGRRLTFRVYAVLLSRRSLMRRILTKESRVKPIEEAGGVLALTLALLLFPGCSGSSSNKAGGKQSRKPVVLTLASDLGDPEELADFTDGVARLSQGAIRIDVESRWRFGQVRYENGLIGDVRAGKADLGVAGSRSWDSVGVTSLRALVAPLLIDSYVLQDRVLRSPLIPEMLKGLPPLDLVGIGVLPGALRKPFGVAHPLLGPSDYAGLTIGVQQSRVADATMRTLGARPVWFASQGPIAGFGGIEQQIDSIQGNRYYRVGKYLTTNVSFWPRSLVVFANQKAFAALTPAQRRILRQALATAVPAQTTLVRAGERREGTAPLCRGGLVRFLTASPGNIAALRRAVQPVYDQLERDPQTRHFIEQIEAMRREVAPERAPQCAPTVRHASAAGPLDGVYRFTVTAAQSPSGVVPENYGAFTFVFDHGRFAQTQENKLACTWAYGTIAVKGDRLEQRFRDGGGIAPTGAANKPGEFFVWRWSLYRDKLKLVPISPPDLPRWTLTRTTASASARYLSKRCPPPAKALAH
jgi:TRAP-type C4-dicarboxylate transport system substrate-binding protein